jgi:PTH1 family peptidyl-tRNA hydrolase
MPIKLILCLQNPGTSYESTRHNAGGWLGQALAKQCNVSVKAEKKFDAHIAQININNDGCKLAIPLTYMNHSGNPARIISQFYQIRPNEILVAHDELDIEPGRIKLKTGGGHGGHNGLRDIISQLGSSEFHRLRIGIGHPGSKELVHNYVLSKPSLSDKQQIDDAISRALSVIDVVINGDLAKAMNQLNT